MGKVIHGMEESRLYKTHTNMKRRCLCAHHKNFKDYGGRGIKVCDEWLKFEPFMRWALSNGYSDDLYIDRIDVNGNYEPSNCRFITKKESNNNRRDNYIITFNGITKTVSEWSDTTGVQIKTIKARLQRYGWPVEKALQHFDGRMRVNA